MWAAPPFDQNAVLISSACTIGVSAVDQNEALKAHLHLVCYWSTGGPEGGTRTTTSSALSANLVCVCVCGVGLEMTTQISGSIRDELTISYLLPHEIQRCGF